MRIPVPSPGAKIPVSVRISSYAQYNTGLFILDLNQAPWGCGTASLKVIEPSFNAFVQEFGLHFGRLGAEYGHPYDPFLLSACCYKPTFLDGRNRYHRRCT